MALTNIHAALIKFFGFDCCLVVILSYGFLQDTFQDDLLLICQYLEFANCYYLHGNGI